jgi:hypothetical protein
VTVGALLREGVQVLGRRWRWLAGGGAAIAAVEALQSGLHGQGVAVALATSLLVVVTQFFAHAVIARRVLLDEGLASETVPARYGHYLLAALAVVVGAFLGAVVLVFPGIMLLLRWSLSTTFTLSRGLNVRDALAASRDATRGHRWTILGAWVVLWLVVGVPYGVLIVAAGGLEHLPTLPLLSLVGLGRLVWTALATCASLAFAVGMFSVLAGRSDRLSEIFA